MVSHVTEEQCVTGHSLDCSLQTPLILTLEILIIALCNEIVRVN